LENKVKTGRPMNPRYRQLRHCIILMIFILGGGLVHGNAKPSFSVALLQGIETRSGVPGFELNEQLEKIYSRCQERLSKSKSANIQVIPVSMREIASGNENQFPDVVKEAEAYVGIARKHNTLAVIKGFYAITEDLFILTFRVCDAKTGAFFAVSTSAKAEQGVIQMNGIEAKIDGLCIELIERILHYNNLQN
jgi:hypothetical protein